MWETLAPVLNYTLPFGLSGGLYWFSNKCRGRNARIACRLSALGALLWVLTWLPLFPFPLSWLTYLPTLLCFWLAAGYVLKEMRAQQRGEYTERVG